MNLSDFFKNKKVLITGHTGFKGSWLTQVMLYYGANVCGYSLKPNTDPNLFTTLGLKKDIEPEHHLADIRDIENLNLVVSSFKPDIIFHLAAQPLVRDSYDNPLSTYETNVMGTVNVLQAIRFNNTKVGIVITTDKVYKESGKDVAHKEDDQLGGYDPYSNSKACSDLIVDSYIKSFFNPTDYKQKHNTLIASARSGNVIGGGDWSKDRIIPDAIRAFFINNNDLVIRNPKAIRPWQHVLEPSYGYILLAMHLYNGEADKVGAWNFGPRDEDMLSVKNVIEMMISLLRKGKYVVKSEDDSKHEAASLKLDSAKARNKLNWKPQLNLEQAIKETISWYEEFYRHQADIKEFTINQIKNYFDHL